MSGGNLDSVSEILSRWPKSSRRFEPGARAFFLAWFGLRLVLVVSDSYTSRSLVARAGEGLAEGDGGVRLMRAERVSGGRRGGHDERTVRTVL
jgi:hypothetical protein